MWWCPYCCRWWSGAGSMKFPNFGYKESGPLSPPISHWWFLFIFKKTTESVIASFKSCHSLSPKVIWRVMRTKQNIELFCIFFEIPKNQALQVWLWILPPPVDVPLDPLASCFSHFTCHMYTEYTETNRIYRNLGGGEIMFLLQRFSNPFQGLMRNLKLWTMNFVWKATPVGKFLVNWCLKSRKLIQGCFCSKMHSD